MTATRPEALARVAARVREESARLDRVRALAVETLALWADVKQDLSAFADALDAMARA